MEIFRCDMSTGSGKHGAQSRKKVPCRQIKVMYELESLVLYEAMELSVDVFEK